MPMGSGSLSLMTATQFRAALKRLRLSQRRLARLVQVDVTTVNRWARGRGPIPESVRLLLECWRRDGVPD